MHSNEISKKSVYDSEKLNRLNYFASLVELGVINLDISIVEAENLQFQLLSLFKEQCSNYNGDFSSSLPSVTANKIMNSIMYTIDNVLLGCENADASAKMIKEVPLAKIFKKGQALLEHMVLRSEKGFKTIKKNLVPINNITYNQTIDSGITEFFDKYDDAYFSAENFSTVDYPLAIDVAQKKGIVFINTFLSRLKIENEFLSYFNSDKIENLLRGYSVDYSDLVVNVYTLVIQNAVGLTLIGENPFELNITQNQRRQIYDILFYLSPKALFEKLTETVDTLFDIIADEFNITKNKDKEKKYLLLTLKRNIASIIEGVKIFKLKDIFITLKEKEVSSSLDFTDNTPMDDDSFRKLVDDLFSCEDSAVKPLIIKNNVKSFEDLRDVLKSGAIFEGEFEEIFSVLEDFQLALLLKVVGDEKEFDRYKSEDEIAWLNAFDVFYKKLPLQKRQTVGEIALQLIIND